MKTLKALVVEPKEKDRQVIDEVMLALGHKYEVASSLAEARELLLVNGYSYVLLSCVIPARPGGTPRRQNTENFLDLLRKLKGQDMPPVIIMYDPMIDLDEEIKVNWTCDMVLRGAKRFIRKPFRTEGRTLDRVIKKVLTGQPDLVRLIAVPLIDMKERQAVAEGVGLSPAKSGQAESVAEEKVLAHASIPPMPVTDGRWQSIPNEPVELDDFMARFCEQRTRETRRFRKRALLAAARHGTVQLPPLAGGHKHGMPNRYLVHDLLAAWQVFQDEGVDLPPLCSNYASGRTFDAAEGASA